MTVTVSRSIIDALTTTLIALTCGALLWAAFNAPRPAKRTPPTVPAAPISIEGAAVKGDPTAPVVIVEFADYQCPACGKFQRETMPALDRAYVQTGRVLWVFRHHPIEQLHPQAVSAARLASCAGLHDKFWQMHEALFANPKDMDSVGLSKRAESVGLDPARVSTCMTDPAITAAVQSDVSHAMSLGLSGTPAFLVGRRQSDGQVRVSRVIPGAGSFEAFEQAIDAALMIDVGTTVARTWWLLTSTICITGMAALVTALVRRRKGIRRITPSATTGALDT